MGLFNSGLDFGLFSLLSVVLGVHPIGANVVSTSVTMCVSFFLNGAWVFQASGRLNLRAFLGFVAVTLSSGILVQGAVIWGVLQAAPAVLPGLSPDWTKMLAKVCAMAVGMVWNYLGYGWLFRKPTGPHEGQAPKNAE